ncbi:2-oxo acid dehydrogenase subunit E2, partial [Myxococcota bacterium]|nr:2-oxo acid dehydrogenase subunit E2 [Myxococcota bacterium]
TSETKLSESKPSATASVAVSKEIPKLYQPRVMQGDKVEKMSTMRSKIAEHMVISKQVSPHVATVWDLDFSRVDMLRKKYKESWKERHGVNLTYTSFIIKAVVDALKEFPVVNASVVGDEIIYHRDINLGLAVALDWGLIVPVIKGAGELNLLGLTRRAADLAERARVKKLMPEEVQDGTFSITNPGIFGSLFGLPVINQPQSAIMAVGTIEKRPVVVTHGDDDMIAIRHKSYFALSFDHRLIDGAVADQFMKKVVTGIETFDEKEF